MKLVVSKEKIINGLQKASTILPVKESGLAYLRSIWLKAADNKLIMMSTDARMEFTGSYDAVVEESGLIGVQGKSFYDLIKQLPDGEITLSLDKDAKNLVIKQGRRSYKLAVNGEEWFQNLAEFPNDNVFNWSGDFFQDVLNRVSDYVSDDQSKTQIASNDPMTCLYMKPDDNGTDVIVCGLNGHQFAKFTFQNDDLNAFLKTMKGLLLQKSYLQNIKKWLCEDEIDIAMSDTRFFVRNVKSGETLSLPCAWQEYPDYNVFLSKFEDKTYNLTFDRQEAINAIKRAQIFITDDEPFVSFSLKHPSEIHIYSKGRDIGSSKEVIACEYEGGVDKIAFNSPQLLDMLGHLNSDKITLLITSEDGPCGIKGDGDLNYMMVAMPIRLVKFDFDEEDDV